MIAKVLQALAGWKGCAAALALGLVLGFGGCWKLRDMLAAQAQLAAAHAQTRAVVAVAKRDRAADDLTARIGGETAVAQERIRIVYRDRIREVPVHVTPLADARCVVPAGFVRIHDAAAAGDPSPLPQSAPGADDAPSGVALSVVGAVVVGNYGTCQGDADRFRRLQDWVKAQQALAAEPLR